MQNFVALYFEKLEISLGLFFRCFFAESFFLHINQSIFILIFENVFKCLVLFKLEFGFRIFLHTSSK